MDYTKTIELAKIAAIDFYCNAYKQNLSYTKLIKDYLNGLYISDSNVIDFIRSEMFCAINNYKQGIFNGEYITKA